MRALFAALLLVVAQVTPAPTPDIPVYAGNPATHFAIEQRVLGVDPDGRFRVLLLARFFDAQNRPTRILANSDLDWIVDHGSIQWQNRMRYGTPAAIVSTVDEAPITATIHANLPAIGTVVVHIDPRAWRGPHVVAGALGPRIIRVGMFPSTTGTPNYRSIGVVPGERYHGVIAPAEPPATTGTIVEGTGMWLYWSLSPLDPEYYANLDPQEVVQRAVRAHMRYVELRVTYGAQWLIPPRAKPTIDALIDGLARHGIVPVAWSVPRADTFEDLAATVRALSYRTARGTPLRGVALDLERGDEFLGSDPSTLWMYARDLRAAVGPHVAIVATIEDPALERLDESVYPYREIARYVNVLQPMAYWENDPANNLPRSYAELRALVGDELPISLGVENGDVEGSIAAGRTAGAIGTCFFANFQWMLK